MYQDNKGFDPEVIAEYKQKMKVKGQNFLIAESDDNSDDYINFYFVGKYEGKEVIYDAVIYTLRLHYHSELYDLAEHKAAQRFPNFHNIRYEEDENGDMKALSDKDEEIGLYITEVMMELEEDEAVKVQEFVEIDPRHDFGVGLDAALNIDKVTPAVISKFVKEYNEDTIKLDETLYAFEEDEEDEETEEMNNIKRR